MYLFIHLYVPPLPSSMESCKFPSCLCSFLKGKPTQWQHSPLRVKNRTKYPTSLLLAELMIPTGVSEMLKGSWDMGTSRSEQGSPFSQKGMNSFTVFSPDKAERLHFTPLCVVCAWGLSTAPGWQLKGCSWGEQRVHQRWVSPVKGQKVRAPIRSLCVWCPPSVQAVAIPVNDFSIAS